MDITFLGTAAAEGFPAVFCNCDYCREARKQGGKNVRTRHQTLINEDLLIDLPADTYHHFLTNGIQGDRIRTLLITHVHSDHLYPKELLNRYGCYAHNMRADRLQLFCSQTVYNVLAPIVPADDTVDLHVIEPYQTFDSGEYRITALPARHDTGVGAYLYVIQGEKTMLYAHDTGYFFEEVFDFLQEKGFVFDFVTLDCTNVDIPISDSGSHMGFPNIDRVLRRLSAMGCINENTVKFVNHFSHNGNPIQAFLEERAAEYGCQVAFDGRKVTF